MFTTDEIKNVCTRFFYQDNKLCYQIILSFNNRIERLSKEFFDYKEYQHYHDNLINKITLEDKEELNHYQVLSN